MYLNPQQSTVNIVMLTIIATLVMVQITIACVTLYLHRGVCHRAVQYHPAVEHLMRFWLWLTTGMVTKQWVAIHRKQHTSEGRQHTEMKEEFLIGQQRERAQHDGDRAHPS